MNWKWKWCLSYGVRANFEAIFCIRCEQILFIIYPTISPLGMVNFFFNYKYFRHLYWRNNTWKKNCTPIGDTRKKAAPIPVSANINGEMPCWKSCNLFCPWVGEMHAHVEWIHNPYWRHLKKATPVSQPRLAKCHATCFATWVGEMQCHVEWFRLQWWRNASKTNPLGLCLKRNPYWEIVSKSNPFWSISQLVAWTKSICIQTIFPFGILWGVDFFALL